MLDPYLSDWLALLLRWFHFTMGVSWIGASFYFVWLNNHVRPVEPPDRYVKGELWAVHGGAFYKVQKFAGAPEQLPKTLHWFKWEAYLTWLSGFSLLALVYWADARSYMIDPAVASLSPATAVAIGLASVIGGWFVYHGLCKSPLVRTPGALAAVIFAFVCAVAYGLAVTLSSRAAFIHVGAMLGTIMAANVFFVIIPGQRAIVDAMIAGREPDVARGAEGALRSLHNNYFTLPVLFVMVSSHFPFISGHPWSWALLVLLGLAGAAIRHHINLHERGERQAWVLPVAAAMLLVVALVARPSGARATAASAAVPFTKVQMIVAQRCLPCHATEPVHSGFVAAPKGVVFDTPDDIRKHAARIKAVAVESKTMPLGNVTEMTDDERTTLAGWLAAQ